jgi:hypothetical protein|mmetsp:Transcript_100823/g.157476  ORF Transcript_100823/g.157476 Transcript_100823/m.157476 type:complete len:359 (+) Transcript_100823:61-1137(+)
MPVPGLHPSSRSVSLESAEQLRELQGYGALTEEPNASGSTPTKDDGDLNELLNLNPSIYDLTVQYSCLAVHRCGGKAGFPSLITVLILEILNVSVQMSILLEVDKKIALPAKAHAGHLYELFTQACYGLSDGPLVYSPEVEENFEKWDDHLQRHELCQFPLTAPNFILLMIGIWTFYLTHELKQTIYFWWHIISLETPGEGRVAILNHNDNFIITHMGPCLKAWVTVIVFLPKLGIAIVLWHIGAGWLTATTGIANLVLNSLALTFICEVDELIFRTCTSEVAKSCLEKTKLPLPSFKYTPSYWEPVETLSTCFGCIALAIVYLHFLQDAIPNYRWDLTEVCSAYNEKHLFARHLVES